MTSIKKGPVAATTRPTRRSRVTKKIIRSIARNLQNIKVAIGSVAFLLMLGAVGGMETDMMDIRQGIVIAVVCFAVIAFLIWTGGNEE